MKVMVKTDSSLCFCSEVNNKSFVKKGWGEGSLALLTVPSWSATKHSQHFSCHAVLCSSFVQVASRKGTQFIKGTNVQVPEGQVV